MWRDHDSFWIFNKGRIFGLYKLKGGTRLSPVMENGRFENHKYSINEWQAQLVIISLPCLSVAIRLSSGRWKVSRIDTYPFKTSNLPCIFLIFFPLSCKTRLLEKGGAKSWMESGSLNDCSSPHWIAVHHEMSKKQLFIVKPLTFWDCLLY